ncbi:MAG: hypothetical protein IJW90_07140 [Clostridia bacterium]|nr:hypothetical protein [Clostridia bacterium]
MRKFYITLMTILLVLTMTVSAGATEYAEPMTEDVTEAAETPTEAVETMTEEVATEASTEAETSPIEADSEISAMLNTATPEQIEQIKEYIIYGISALPLPDQVRVFAAENLNAIAWIVAGVTFLLFFIGNRISKKSWSDSMTVMNNNMAEVYDDAQKIVEEAKSQTAGLLKEINKALQSSEEKSAAMLEEARACTERALTTLEERSKELFEKAKEGTDAAIKALEEEKKRETGLTESEMLMAKVLCDLVQNSNLPQWKKDEFAIHLNEGIAKIAEVTEHDDTEA